MALMAFVPLAAKADTPAANYTVLSATTAVTIKYGPGTFFGGIALGAETNPLNCYDGLTTGGVLLSNATLTNAAPSYGLFTVPPSGIFFATGLTCQVPTAIVATVLVLWF